MMPRVISEASSSLHSTSTPPPPLAAAANYMISSCGDVPTPAEHRGGTPAGGLLQQPRGLGSRDACNAAGSSSQPFRPASSVRGAVSTARTPLRLRQRRPAALLLHARSAAQHEVSWRRHQAEFVQLRMATDVHHAAEPAQALSGAISTMAARPPTERNPPSVSFAWAA